MDFLTELWQPIVLSAVLVWIASFLVHAVLPIHKGEFVGLPNEDQALSGLAGVPEGNYMFPFGTMADMKDPAFLEKQKRGPIGTMIVWPGPVSMGRNLILTFLSYIVIGVFIAYILWHAFDGRAPEYLKVFRIAGASAFLAYCLGLLPQAIWYRGIRMWSLMFDAIVYSVLTAGTFAWLWHTTVAT